MLASQHPLFVYARVLEPWNELAVSAHGVSSLRLSLLPWLWWDNPLKACEEIQQIILEKSAAMQETGFAITQAPMRFWLDILSAAVSNDPVKAFYQAMINSSGRIAQPAGRRVKANLKGLTN